MEVSLTPLKLWIWVNNRGVLAQFEVSSLDMSFALKFDLGSHELISLSTIEAMGFLSFLPSREGEVQDVEKKPPESVFVLKHFISNSEMKGIV